MRLILISTLFLTSLLFADDKVKVLLNPKKNEMNGALCVIFPKGQVINENQKYFKYKVINRTKQNIFAVINNGRSKDGFFHLKGPSIWVGGGGIYTGLESTHQSLRLLYAPRLEDGQPTSGEDILAAETNCISNVQFTGDIKKYDKAEGVFMLTLSFYATNAKGFQTQKIKVPIHITVKKDLKNAKTKTPNKILGADGEE